MTAFRPGDRVQARSSQLTAYCGQLRARSAWAGRRGTIAAMGAAVGNGKRLYVLWDGNRHPKPAFEGFIEPAGPVVDEWAIEPPTTG